MKQKPILSILIGAIPERFDKARSLYERLMAEVGDKPVQVLLIMDNRIMQIGEKRDALVQLAAGKYISFIDDDEDFFPGYIDFMLDACSKNVDVITFLQKCTIDGNSFTVNFDLNNIENEEARKNESGNYIDINRRPFHVCGWRSKIAKSEHFAAVGYGEDWDWCQRILPKCKTQYKIPGHMHHYIWDSKTTAAPTESNSVWTNPNDKK